MDNGQWQACNMTGVVNINGNQGSQRIQNRLHISRKIMLKNHGSRPLNKLDKESFLRC